MVMKVGWGGGKGREVGQNSGGSWYLGGPRS